MAMLLRSFAAVALVPLFAFVGNKSDAPELPKAFRGQFASVPSGTLQANDVPVKVEGFLMATTEVSNAEYGAFVNEVRTRGDAALLAIVLPDTEQWIKDHAFQEPYRQNYFRHPAYANYPVVNVGHDGAVAYCRWLQDKMNAQAGADRFEVRLPTRSEWWYAANGGSQRTNYAWGGPGLRNAKGCAMANFRHVGDENVRLDPATGRVEVIENPQVYPGVAGQLTDNVDITAPVNSYAPNHFGLYNMNGNVAEMLAEEGQAAGGSWRSPGYDIRNESLMAFNGPSPEVGFRVLVEVR